MAVCVSVFMCVCLCDVCEYDDAGSVFFPPKADKRTVEHKKRNNSPDVIVFKWMSVNDDKLMDGQWKHSHILFSGLNVFFFFILKYENSPQLFRCGVNLHLFGGGRDTNCCLFCLCGKTLKSQPKRPACSQFQSPTDGSRP